MKLEIKRIQETESTNSYMMEHMDEFKEQFAVVAAAKQTAGRGLDGNRWEAEEGKNALFSILFRPEYITPQKQFVISMLISKCILKVMERLFPKKKKMFSIKWPNDIYYKDYKLGGILIENRLRGDKLEASIIGIGLNVNQTDFSPEVPNPVSLSQITKGKEMYVDEIIDAVVEQFCARMQFLEMHTKEHGESFFNAMTHMLTENYNENLYWNDDEPHPFRAANGEEFQAKILEVLSTGRIKLQLESGEVRQYWLKEMRFVNTH